MKKLIMTQTQNPSSSNPNYAHLPDELLSKILEHVPETVSKVNSMFNVDDEPVQQGIEYLREQGMVTMLPDGGISESVIAVDGSVIVEKMSSYDLLLALAVGVEGLTTDPETPWGGDRNQYYQWQTVLPHGEANARLSQGIMFLMELSVLANAGHEVRIMDGAHFSSIIKINGMLSAKDENADENYAEALKKFLSDTYSKIIPDIPDIIRAAFNDDRIISLAKYSSSRDIINSYLTQFNINLDDKTFFTLALNEGEYMKPRPVGQSAEEREKIWDDLHIRCNLEIPDVDLNELNAQLQRSIMPLRTKDENRNPKESELYFMYYKPFEDAPAYKIELKKSLAVDTERLEKYLRSLKNQVVFPQIREPYPQYLVDLMAKSIATGMFAIKEAIMLSPELQIDKGKMNLLMHYRT